MKIGLLMTTFNRSEYLKQCFDSLVQCDNSKINVVAIVDDASTEEDVLNLLHSLMLGAKGTLSVEFKKANEGIHDSIKSGCKTLFVDNECDAVVTIDPDTIHKKDWINKLVDLHMRYPNTIATGFNTLVGGRHKITAEHEDYYLKATIGGINMCFNREVYKKFIEPNLVALNWDWLVCKAMQDAGMQFVVTKPSVIQHIGLKKGMHVSPNDEPDVAKDFIY